MHASVRPARLLGPVLLVAGAACLVVGYLQGEATLSLFVIFPVITATGGWSALGILLLIAGFFGFFLTRPNWTAADPASPGGPTQSAASPPTAPAGARRWGGVVFLGPVPVIFGSDAKIARWMIVVGVLLFVGLLVLTIISLWGI
jgi:uncharacterized protein (TIGR00304 family)